MLGLLKTKTAGGRKRMETKQMKSIALIFFLGITVIHASTQLPDNPLWKYRPMEYKSGYQAKRNRIINLLEASEIDSLKILLADTIVTTYMTYEERFLLKAIIFGEQFISVQDTIDSLFAESNRNPAARKKIDVSPYQKLLYSRAVGDKVITILYKGFHQVIDSLRREEKIDDKTALFYKIVFPLSPQDIIQSGEEVTNYVKTYPETKKSTLLYDFYYRIGEWNRSGFNFGLGFGFHFFNENGSEYFDPNLAYQLLYFDIIIKGFAIKAGLNFTGHNNKKEIEWNGHIVPSNESLNFSELYIGGGYMASIKNRVFILPYAAYTRVQNNLNAKLAKSLDMDPQYPKLNALKIGTTLYFDVHRETKFKSIFERAEPLVSIDYWFDTYDLEHLQVKKPAIKHSVMIGISVLIGKKDKKKI
jgi:hypothetical protein